MTLEFLQNVTAEKVAHGIRLVATRPIARGDTVLWLEGILVETPARHSLQVGDGLHLVAPVPNPLQDESGRYLWVFLNHHCRPNAWVRGRELRAIRAIEPQEEITFNYDATEWDMACPFSCHCSAPDCLGTIRGFRYLGPSRRLALAPYLPDYLRRRLED